MGKKKYHGRLEVKGTEAQKTQKHVTPCNSGTSTSRQNLTPTILIAKASHSGTNISVETCTGELEYESPLEKMIVKVNDKDTLVACIEALEGYLKKRRVIFDANTNVCYEEFEGLIRSKKLESNLTKCTKFVKKLRQYSESQRTSVQSDIKVLNLSKYLSEIASALVDSKVKLEDVREIISVCSMLHQRYSEFSAALLENFKRILPSKKMDMTSFAVNKVTVDFRIFVDLILCGIISDGFPLLLISLRNLITNLKDSSQCFVPIVYLCRAVGYELTGILPKNIRKLCDKHGVQIPKCSIVPNEKKQQLVILLKEFYFSQTRLLQNANEESLKSEMYNRRLMKTKGELLPERIEAHTDIKSKCEKILLNIRKLAYILNLEVLELRTLPAADPEEELEKPVVCQEGFETIFPGIVFFDDEETRALYQDFPDLKMYLQPIVYREAAKEVEAMAEREKEASNVDEDAEKAELKSDEILELEDSVEAEENELPPSMRQANEEERELDSEFKPSFQTYLDNLKNCVNRNMIDRAAFEFAEKFNSKQNRKKLAKTIFNVPRNRVDLLPLWSRLVAILHPVMPDLGQELSSMLMKDFQYLLRKKHPVFIETKLKITRLIAELVNFRVFPKSEALYCLKLLLKDFVHHQIEMCCAFVESCGQFLHRHPESGRRFRIYLDEMMRKKQVKALEPRYLNLVDQAYNYVVRPKEAIAHKAKKLPVLEAYLQKVVWYDLDKGNVEATIVMLRRLDWEADPETTPTVLRVLSNPCEISYNRLPYLASVISGISEYRSEVGVKVLDKVLEDIKVGMDYNHVQFNQRRMTICAFLGQLYLYRIASGVHIFATLYDFIIYGVKAGKMQQGQNKAIIDRPDDLFRIRLACQILKICGEYFSQGATKRTLDIFIKYLQRYYWSKRVHPFWKARLRYFPCGILEDLEETIKRIRPRTKLYKSWDDAEMDVRAMEKEIAEEAKAELKEVGYDAAAAMENLPLELKQIIESAAEARRLRNADSVNWTLPNEVVPQGTKRDPERNVGDPCLKYESGSGDHKNEEDNAKFLRELDKLCSEVNYSASRDGGKYMTSTIPIPLHIRNDSMSKPVTDDPFGMSGQESVNFTLITRKGHKQQYKTLPVPASSDFVVNLRSREEAERAEKERVKQRTLQMNDLQVAEEEKEFHASQLLAVLNICRK